MTSVTFDEALGGDNSTVSDDANPTTGLRKGGYRTRFVAALAQFVAMCGFAKTKAEEAAASALTALNAPGTTATSTTPQTWTGASVGSDFTWTIQTGKTIVPTMDFKAGRTSAAATQAIYGAVKSYNPATGQLVLTATSVVGTGTGVSDWDLSLSQSAGIPTSRSISGGGLATGGGDLSANRTITVTKASASEIALGAEDGKAMTPKGWADGGVAQTLTFAANIAWAITRRKAKVTLTGSAALQEPTGAVEGAYYGLTVIMGGSGGYALSYAGCYEFEFGEIPETPGGVGDELYLYMECLSVSPVRFFVRSATSAT